jgi:DNA-directed RNA polymerase subunit F
MIGKRSELKGDALINEVVDILEERKKRGALTYEQQRTYDHAKRLEVQKKKAEQEKKALEALGILSAGAVIKIIELSPKGIAVLNQLLAKEQRVFSEDEKKKILSIVGI